MSREYAIESSKLPLSIRGTLSHPAVHGVYLEELPYSVSGTSEISSDEYSVIEDGLMNVEGISDISCPFTHSYAAYIYISEPGTYRFYVHANFGAEATIYDGEHGVSVSVSGGRDASSSEVGEITFARRGYYKVEVKYYSTGEASPVLELHFGESSPDMATRTELPVFRDFYILDTEYATLLGDGSVLRPGETCTIDLHNISEYYSIYGGSVTVWRADGVKTYPLEYDRVTIPMASILAGNVYPSSGCSARVTVLASSGGGCGCGCGEGGTSRTFTFDATVVPENYRENNDNQRVCACSNKTIAENTHCISFSQNIGRTPWVEGTPVGQVFIEEDKPSQAMLTPAVLKYRHVMRRKLLNVSTTPSSGYLDVSDGCGQFTRYNLATGRATGISVTEDSMLASSGTEWVEQFADRSQVVYDSSGQMVRYVTSGGIVLGTKDFGIDIVESSGQIRQIYSVADGLMNVTSLSSSGSSGSFRIDWYSPNAVISSGATGYVTSAGANPVKSFSFSGTYQPALNNRDLKFHLTESRYGGTQTYYTGWEYSEEYDSDTETMIYQGWAMYKGSTPTTIQQTDLRMITSGDYYGNFHVSNVIVSGSCTLANYYSSGGNALYERNAEVNAGGLGNARMEEYIGSDSERTEYMARVSSGYGVGKASYTEDKYGRSTRYEYDSLSRGSKSNLRTDTTGFTRPTAMRRRLPADSRITDLRQSCRRTTGLIRTIRIRRTISSKRVSPIRTMPRLDAPKRLSSQPTAPR